MGLKKYELPFGMKEMIEIGVRPSSLIGSGKQLAAGARLTKERHFGSDSIDKVVLCQRRFSLFCPVLEIFSATGYGEAKFSVKAVKVRVNEDPESGRRMF